MSKDTRYLDGIRGLAALIVVAGHVSAAGMDLVPGLKLIGSEKDGVWLFFILSAYLLTPKLDTSIGQLGFIQAVTKYAIRRLLRILPLYYVVLFALTLFGYLGFTASVAAMHAVLLRGDLHFWTMPVEMSFYFILPIMLFIIRWFDWRRLPSFAVISCIAAIIYVTANPLNLVLNSFALPNYAVFFASGMLLSSLPKVRLRPAIANAILSFSVLLLFLFTPSILSSILDVDRTYAFALSIIFIIPWCAIIYVVPSNSVLNNVFSSSIMSFLALLVLDYI